MTKIKAGLIFWGLLVLPVLAYSQDPANFSTSLHGIRQGKAHFYSKDHGGFEVLTHVAVDSLGCLSCHPTTYADGSQVDAATYKPDCIDCHDFTRGTGVADEQCLQCHGRQKTEIMKMKLTDVHRDRGFSCTTCHTKKEMHGDGTSYTSLLQPGATEVTCETCHTSLPSNSAHSLHTATLDCKTCHTQTVITCYNCHFESEVEGKVKRAFGGLQNFMLLTMREGSNKIHPATFMALTYQGKSFYTIAPYTSHSVVKQGRACSDCHNNPAVQKIKNGEKVKLVQWDPGTRTITNFRGVIPVPSNWRDLFQFDFLTYTGDVAAATDPSKWEFLKSEVDTNQMLFNQPLSDEQINKLSIAVAVDEKTDVVPNQFKLVQNYPNPFNPATIIEFHLPKKTEVSLAIYDLTGKVVKTLLAGRSMNPGIHKVEFVAGDLPSGIYYYRIKAGKFWRACKMTVLK